MTGMTISEAARKAGIGVETVRFYERKGLIRRPPKPLSGGYRVYPDETIQRMRFIRQAKELGFSLREIDELLALRADPARDCAAVRGRAEAKLDEVDRKIAQLRRIRKALTELIGACPGKGAALRRCSIIQALEPGDGSPDPERGKAKKQTAP